MLDFGACARARASAFLATEFKAAPRETAGRQWKKQITIMKRFLTITAALAIICAASFLLPRATAQTKLFYSEDLKASLDMPARLVAPVTKGKQVGTLKVQLDGKTLLERPLVALADGAEGGFFKRLSDGVWMWFKGDAGANVSATPKGD